MASGDGTADLQPSETTPLLLPRDEEPAPTNESIEDQNTDAEENGAPIANPPNSTRLWVILMNTWVGVFLGALGTPYHSLAFHEDTHIL